MDAHKSGALLLFWLLLSNSHHFDECTCSEGKCDLVIPLSYGYLDLVMEINLPRVMCGRCLKTHEGIYNSSRHRALRLPNRLVLESLEG